MADFVRNHVRGGEVAFGAETLAQFVEEGEVEVHVLVAGTIERSARGAGQAARRFHLPPKQNDLRLAVGSALFGEELAPDFLGIAEHHADEVAELLHAYPDRFIGLARISGLHGMRGVRELEHRVREQKFVALGVSALVDGIPASDRRYYPLYAKAAELDIPVRVYSSMNYATDRPYDLGHPRHLDQVAIDFPELTLIGGLGGWPWVNEMVALVRRHPKLHLDTSAHRGKYLGQRGSGWEMLLQFGNTLIQDKVLVGLSTGLVGQSHETLIEEYMALPLKDTVKEKWLYSNAARVFGIG